MLNRSAVFVDRFCSGQFSDEKGGCVMLARRKRISLWFWVALVALLTNPLMYRLLLNLLQAGVQFIGSHVPLP
jgi:hypothetical protein